MFGDANEALEHLRALVQRVARDNLGLQPTASGERVEELGVHARVWAYWGGVT